MTLVNSSRVQRKGGQNVNGGGSAWEASLQSGDVWQGDLEATGFYPYPQIARDEGANGGEIVLQGGQLHLQVVTYRCRSVGVDEYGGVGGFLLRRERSVPAKRKKRRRVCYRVGKRGRFNGKLRRQMVELGKKGPIYSCEWSPTGNVFCAVYGFMPAKATLYDQKGNVNFDYGTGPRNNCFFNQHGTLLMIAGFGNLRGKMECWDVEKHEKISEPEAPDTTHFEWCPGTQYHAKISRTNITHIFH